MRFERLDHGGHLDQAGDVPARAHIQLDVGHLDPEDLVVIFLEPGALLHRLRRPLPEAHDHVDAFLERTLLMPNISAMLMMPMPRHSM